MSTGYAYNCSYGKCSEAGCGLDSVMQERDGNDKIIRQLCKEHNRQHVNESNFQFYTRQAEERVGLKQYRQGEGTCLVLFVSDRKNLDGQYYAALENPSGGCGVGFGHTPARALRDLALKLADEADKALHRINEQLFEWRQLKEEITAKE